MMIKDNDRKMLSQMIDRSAQEIANALGSLSPEMRDLAYAAIAARMAELVNHTEKLIQG